MVNAPNLRALSRKLTDTKVKASKPKPDGRPENLTDGGGLYLHVKTGTNGSVTTDVKLTHPIN